MSNAVIGQSEDEELVTEYSVVGQATSISSTVGFGSSTSSSDENLSTNGETGIETSNAYDAIDENVSVSDGRSTTASGSISSEIYSTSVQSVSLPASLPGLSSATRQYAAVTQTPVIQKRKGILKAETADVEVKQKYPK